MKGKIAILEGSCTKIIANLDQLAHYTEPEKRIPKNKKAASSALNHASSPGLSSLNDCATKPDSGTTGLLSKGELKATHSTSN